MSTIVYQGLQSCIESTTLKLKVASSSFMVDCDHRTTMEINNKSSSSSTTTTTTTNSNLDTKSWDFLQNLSNISSSPKNQSLYIHPLDKRSPSLSQESLELCTENLGSETGSDTTMEISILSNTSSSLQQKHNKIHQPRNHHHKMMNNSHDFPPPLTTMCSNSKPLHFQSHRENGRLIIEAIETPSRNSCFQAERSNGRLRLCLWKDSAINEDEEEYASDVNGEENYQENDEDYDDDEDEEEDMEVNKFDDEVEIGMEKFQRLSSSSRCKEGGRHGNNKGLCNWKPMWVATS